MSDLPIIYVPQASFTSRTNILVPLIPIALKAIAVMGVEWTTLDFIEQSPRAVKIATFAISVFMLTVLAQKDWLRFKGKFYFPTAVALLLGVYMAIVGYSYLRYEPHTTPGTSTAASDVAKSTSTASTPVYLQNVLFSMPPQSLWQERGVVTLEADPAVTLNTLRIFLEERTFISGNPEFSSSGQWYPSYGRIPIADVPNVVKGVHIRLPFIYDSKRGMFEHVLSYGSASAPASLPGTEMINDMSVYPIEMKLIIIGSTADEQQICQFIIFNPSGKFRFLFVNGGSENCKSF